MYDGTTPVEWHLVSFEGAARINGWSSRQKAEFYLQSLTPRALEVVVDVNPRRRGAYRTMKARIRRRFGSDQNESRASLKFYARQQERGENTDAFAQALQTMSSAAYPSIGNRARQVMMCQQFVNGLADPEVQKQVRLQEPRNFREAVAKASSISSICGNDDFQQRPKRNGNRDPYDGPRVRQITANDPADDMVREVRDLRQNLTADFDRLKRTVDSATHRGRDAPPQKNQRSNGGNPQKGQPRNNRPGNGRDVPRRNEGRRDDGQNRSPGTTCFTCNRTGHYARDCPTKWQNHRRADDQSRWQQDQGYRGSYYGRPQDRADQAGQPAQDTWYYRSDIQGAPQNDPYHAQPVQQVRPGNAGQWAPPQGGQQVAQGNSPNSYQGGVAQQAAQGGNGNWSGAGNANAAGPAPGP